MFFPSPLWYTLATINSQSISPCHIAHFSISESTKRLSLPDVKSFLPYTGYGNIAPTTNGGRLFCIVFALVGIPLTLTVLANLGQPLVNLLPVNTIEKLMPK